MVESRKFEEDFLHRIVHVGEIKSIFLEFAQEARVQEKLDPMHIKWDSIQCDDIRSLREKFTYVYKVCCKEIKKFLKEHTDNLLQDEIEILLNDLTDSAYALMRDKAQTYNVAFEDRDMIRKTVVILFQDCYLALDRRKSING